MYSNTIIQQKEENENTFQITQSLIYQMIKAHFLSLLVVKALTASRMSGPYVWPALSTQNHEWFHKTKHQYMNFVRKEGNLKRFVCFWWLFCSVFHFPHLPSPGRYPFLHPHFFPGPIVFTSHLPFALSTHSILFTFFRTFLHRTESHFALE